MIILGKVRPLSRHLAEPHPQVSIIALDFHTGVPGGYPRSGPPAPRGLGGYLSLPFFLSRIDRLEGAL
ncbi:hypothetical protein EAH80_22085 [Mycobacterium hodleri]|uniref:Uncharacterized protein n=1 Tax=Mycolicibacterium hodleri TaxID=49897 RepID=A0A502E238_9MYCO|nr:hypothetical protein EAH80_22085 [Mycolicibacterium hodleri]